MVKELLAFSMDSEDDSHIMGRRITPKFEAFAENNFSFSLIEEESTKELGLTKK